MAVQLATTIGVASHGIKTSGMGTIGEDSHETVNVEVHLTTMKAMVEEVSEEIVPIMALTVEEAIGISMIVDLELVTKATGVLKDIKSPTIGGEVIEIGTDAII